jgi:hypothetical protein
MFSWPLKELVKLVSSTVAADERKYPEVALLL